MSPLTSHVVLEIGPLAITRPVITTWIIMVVLVFACERLTRRLQGRPGRAQAALEVAVAGLERQIG